ncbi:MAG: rod shape-determining protein MreD [Candidatus Omnitrophota bacterium]|jgi:rod shape-determining protein MreD
MRHALSGRIIFYLFFLLILDLCFVPLAALHFVRPSCLLLVILYVSLEWQWERTVTLALLVGLMRDAVGSHPFGIETAVLVSASVALDFVVHKIERRSWLMRLAVTWVYTFTVFSSLLLLSGFFGYREFLTREAFALCFQAAFYAALAMPVFFLFTSRWFARRQVIRQYELFD